MVTKAVLQQAQATLTDKVNQRFDGAAYYGLIQKPYFIIDFFANDQNVVTEQDIESYLDGVQVTENEVEYVVSVEETPDTGYKYTYLLTLSKV